MLLVVAKTIEHLLSLEFSNATSVTFWVHLLESCLSDDISFGRDLGFPSTYSGLAVDIKGNLDSAFNDLFYLKGNLLKHILIIFYFMVNFIF